MLTDLIVPYFSLDELTCKCGECDSAEMIIRSSEWRSLMEITMNLRQHLAFPFKVNSAHRCPAHNARVSSTGEDGPHTIAALDIGCSFERAYALINAATDAQLGVGIQQKGDVASRFVHIDNLGARVWSY